MGYTVKDFAFRMRNDVMVKGDRHKVADIIEQQAAELTALRAENERLKEAAVSLQCWIEDNSTDEFWESIPADLWNAVTYAASEGGSK